MSLFNFCKSNPELNYNSLCKYIYRQIKKNPNQTIEQITFLKQNKQENDLISLDEPYGNDNSDHQKNRLDVIADTNKPYEAIENNSFSSNMMEALQSLPLEDLSFILLKYQENYTDEELADYFHLSTYEVCQKE